LFSLRYVHRCGHCKHMAAAWEQLSDEWAGKPNVLIAEVDCTTEEGKPLCDKNEIQGFPSLKFGDPADLEDYEGDRDFESLSGFATENLKPVCSPTNIDLCDDERKAKIQELQQMSADDLGKLIKEQEEKINRANEKFESEIEALQERYEKVSEEKESTIAEIMASGLKLMRSVQAAAKVATGSEEL